MTAIKLPLRQRRVEWRRGSPPNLGISLHRQTESFAGWLVELAGQLLTLPFEQFSIPLRSPIVTASRYRGHARNPAWMIASWLLTALASAPVLEGFSVHPQMEAV
jgi:hypothetical protein